MCGIVGYVGKKSVVPIIIEGLRRLEYRGYDSAGIAVAGDGDGLQLRPCRGQAAQPRRSHPAEAAKRHLWHWGTHAGPRTDVPPKKTLILIRLMCTGKIVVGTQRDCGETISALKIKAHRGRHKFTTETDTEIIAHLVEKYSGASGNERSGKSRHASLEDAVRQTLKQLTGVFCTGRNFDRRAQQDCGRLAMGPPAG